MRHQKFLALSANAICLWHEGKDYCAEYHTDGLIPSAAVKQFRFRGVKAVAMLTASCGQKPDGSPYAPLWEAHPVGFKMHDYLAHNDCRDAVMARMEQAEERHEAGRERLARWREKKRVTQSVSETPEKRSITETLPVSEPVSATPPKPTEQVLEGGAPTAPPPRPLAPIHDRSHRNHAHCGRVCLHATLFGEFVRRRNHTDADREIRDFCMDVERQWGDGSPNAHVEPGDPFDFWKARYAERWPAAAMATTSTRRPTWAPRRAQV